MYGYGFAVLHARFETPFFHGFDGLLIETQAERADHLDVLRATVFVDHQRQQHGALPLRFASFFGVFRLNLGENAGGRNAATDAISPTAESTTGTRADTCAGARSYTAAATVTDAAAGAHTVGRQTQVAQRVTQVVGQNIGDVVGHNGRRHG